MTHSLRAARQIGRIREDGLYRRLRPGNVEGAYITINGRRLVNLCSNDYLGLPASRMEIGQMQSSSRLVSGNDVAYAGLERGLAAHKSQPGALVYPTGYMANLGAIQAIVNRGDAIFSDELNHASIIDACRLSGGRVSIYRHNDMDGLGIMLARASGPKFVITEGIFSMDGDYADLARITELAQKSGAAVIIDDAHGDFVAGHDGRGTADHLGVADMIDLYVSSLSKGLGSFGGYVAARDDVIDLCVNTSRTLIYTSALPSSLIRHAAARLGQDREGRRRRLAQNVEAIACGLKNAGYMINSDTHIIPVMVGGEKEAVRFGEELAREGVFAQPIRYPTVARGRARIRLSVTAWLGRDEIDHIVCAFERAGKRTGII